MPTFGTWSSGDVLTAADVNVGLPSCLLESASQTVATATLVDLTFSTESYDPLGWHSTSTNTERITPNIAGVYLASVGTSDISFGVAGRVVLSIAKNNSIISRFDMSATLIYGGSVSVVVEMNGTTDYLTFKVLHSHGTNRDFQLNHFGVTRIAG